MSQRKLLYAPTSLAPDGVTAWRPVGTTGGAHMPHPLPHDRHVRVEDAEPDRTENPKL